MSPASESSLHAASVLFPRVTGHRPAWTAPGVWLLSLGRQPVPAEKAGSARGPKAAQRAQHLPVDFGWRPPCGERAACCDRGRAWSWTRPERGWPATSPRDCDASRYLCPGPHVCCFLKRSRAVSVYLPRVRAAACPTHPPPPTRQRGGRSFPRSRRGPRGCVSRAKPRKSPRPPPQTLVAPGLRARAGLS